MLDEAIPPVGCGLVPTTLLHIDGEERSGEERRQKKIFKAVGRMMRVETTAVRDRSLEVSGILL